MPTPSSPLLSFPTHKTNTQTQTDMREITCTQNAHEELPAFSSIEQTLQRAQRAPEQLPRLSDIFIFSHPSVPRPLSFFLSLLIFSLFLFVFVFFFLSDTRARERISRRSVWPRLRCRPKRHVCGRGWWGDQLRGLPWLLKITHRSSALLRQRESQFSCSF